MIAEDRAAPTDRVVGSALPATVFLDRDGVLNQKAPDGSYVTSRASFAWLPGALPALARLSRAGTQLVIVTNQRGVALGRMTERDLEGIHAALRHDVEAAGGRIAAIYSCMHDADACGCRKPGTELFLRAAAEHPSIDLADSVLVGDSLSDVEAGNRLAIPTYLVGRAARRVAREAARSGLRVARSYPSLQRLVDEAFAPPVPDVGEA